MKKFVALVCGTIAFAPVAAALPGQPQVPPAKPVTETIFGHKVTDRYRYFEREGPAVTNWMKAEGRFTRGYLDALPGHADMLARMSAMTGSMDAVQTITRSAGGRIFFEQRREGSDNFDLMVRDAGGQVRKIVDVSAIRAAHGDEPFAINYFAPSNDGSKVAVGISEGGSEDSSLWIYDANSGERIAGPIDKAQVGAIGWAANDSYLFLNQLQTLKPGQPESDKYNNSRAYVWDMKNPPVPLLGNGVPQSMAFKPTEIPLILTSPGSDFAIAGSANGVENELALWTAPLADAARPGAHWQKLVDRADGVTGIAVSGNHIFLMSHKDAPTFKVLEVDAGQPISAAHVVVPASSDRVIGSIAAAADGLYVGARRGVYSELIKVPSAGGNAQVVELPVKGSINELAADPRVPGVDLILDSWAVPQKTYVYAPDAGFSDLGLGHAPAGFDASLYESMDLKAAAEDGVEIPLSYITAKGAAHPRPLLLWAYGSYGIPQFPGFGNRSMILLPNGIDYAVCHVRGGGELGEAWRLGGKDANKAHTWRDLIACADALIARGYAAKGQLFIGGGSAGGITMGRAMEERPDLFAGVFDLVPGANPIRAEFSVSGPANIPEFGTITTEDGFKNLLAMDSVQHVKQGVQYPPILITTGLNDPRVSSWEPAKLAATLRTSGDRSPVLFRVDEKAGHGIGSTKSQNDLLYADIASLILAWSGHSADRPQKGERGR